MAADGTDRSRTPDGAPPADSCRTPEWWRELVDAPDGDATEPEPDAPSDGERRDER